MYGEMVYQNNPGMFSPVSESAYCIAGSLHTILLHTANDTLQVMRGVPQTDPTWHNVSFYNLRSDSGILVSAVKEQGRVSFVSLSRAVGSQQPSVVDVKINDRQFIDGPVNVQPTTAHAAKLSGGTWRVTLPANTTTVLYTGNTPPSLIVKSVPLTPYTRWGYQFEPYPMH